MKLEHVKLVTKLDQGRLAVGDAVWRVVILALPLASDFLGRNDYGWSRPQTNAARCLRAQIEEEL